MLSALCSVLPVLHSTPSPQLLSSYFWGANKEGLRLKETVPLAVHYRWEPRASGQGEVVGEQATAKATPVASDSVPSSRPQGTARARSKPALQGSTA